MTPSPMMLGVASENQPYEVVHESEDMRGKKKY